ncbi:MAG TPA: hypothetical protein VNE86_05785 [Nitrososphaerales archaeon]|nr:hypothetical protein [Nitrososphaerales archaeon]
MSLDLKEINGKYVLGISSSVAAKEELVRKGSGRKKIVILFLASLSLAVALDIAGMLLPDASFGRTLIYLGFFPAILVNIISARYIIRNISQPSQETVSHQV